MTPRRAAALFALVCAGALSSVSGVQPVAAAGGGSTSCQPGAIVSEHMRAPDSVALGQAFTVRVSVLNCTQRRQSVTLEGRQAAPSPCTAPVIDPLPVQLAPGERFRLREDVPGQSCSGVYTVTWGVYQGGAELVHRTRHITIVNNT